MALNVSAWSIRQPLPSIVMMATLVAIGSYTFTKMPITRMPNIDVPVVSVVITQFGASPAELETQVTKKVEDAVASIDGMHHIDSQIVDGIATTTITFRLEVDTTRALNDVKDAITRIRADLPRTIDEPYVQRYEIAPLPILTYAAIAPGKTPEQLSWFVEDIVIRALQGIPGVGRVERMGRVEREIRVGLDPVRLIGVGLTAVDVSRQLKGSNVDVAGGRAEIGGRGEAIRTLAGAKTVAELRATRIALLTGGDLRLDDLGSVTDGIAEQNSFARYNNVAVVGFSIMRSKGTSDVVVGDAVKTRIEAIKKEHPEVELKLIDSSVTFTLGNYDQALHTLYEGAVLAIIVVFLFLRDWRATIIAAITLPLSILPSFWVMNAMGFSLNIISLLAIVLTTGILVDDAIVEIENIVRHIRMGKSPYQASLDAADEIGLAVIAISLTVVAIFVPASFMQSIPGQFFKQFGLTVAVQVLFSLLCARLITPMLAAYFLKPHQHEEKADGPVMRRYGRLVVWAVRHRFVTIAIGLLVFAVSLAGAIVLPSGFLPPSDTARSTLCIELTPGSQLTDTQEITDIITKRLLGRPEVESVFVDGGRTPPDRTEVRVATLTINYVPKEKRSLSQKELEQAISRDLAGVPDFRFWYLDENGQRNVSFIVTGKEIATVGNVAAELASHMRGLPMLDNVVSTATLNRPELRIRPRRDLAVRLGITTESLSETIRVATIGDLAPYLARYNDEAADRIVAIRVLLEEQARADQQVLEQLRVPSPVGGGVPLMALADFSFGEGPINIDRHDRQRQAAVEADLVSGAALSEAQDAVRALPMLKNLPAGVTFFEGGDAELQDDLFAGFNTALRQGLTMAYVVLALLFGSLLQPLTVMFSLPLSVAGAIMALYIVKLPMTTPVVIGILMLMGIVGKNAIMLVDFAAESIHKGMDRTAAIIDAGQKRARPILMTSIAMAAGMAPSALGIGAGGEFRSPMANAVIGGILVSTLLSLLFVPALFTIVDDLGILSARFFGRLIGPADEAEPAHAPSIALRHDEPTATTKLEKKETQGELRKPDLTPAK
jgi:multidrug efflux pump subunit AcrB